MKNQIEHWGCRLHIKRRIDHQHTEAGKKYSELGGRSQEGAITLGDVSTGHCLKIEVNS